MLFTLSLEAVVAPVATPSPIPPATPTTVGAGCIATATYVWSDLSSNCDTACATKATGKACVSGCMSALNTQVRTGVLVSSNRF